MAVTVPTEHPLARKQDHPPYMARPITKDTAAAMVKGAMYAYGKASRRVLLQIYNVDLVGVSAGTAIGRAIASIAATREDGDLKVAWYAVNADVDVIIRDRADTTTFGSYAISETTGAKGSGVLSLGASTTADILLEVEGEGTGAGAKLLTLVVWVEGHDAASLP